MPLPVLLQILMTVYKTDLTTGLTTVEVENSGGSSLATKAMQAHIISCQACTAIGHSLK